MIKMRYCKKCVYPFVAANLDIPDDGVCSSCETFDSYESITKKEWIDRRKKLEELIRSSLSKNNSNYDCIIPVSGGKDSYYQAHIVTKELGLKPLLVTYHGNNYLPEGDYNRDNMRQVFNADHIVWGPSAEVLKKLNRIGFKRMGDMNWQNHCGIMSAPIQVAVNFNIPLVIWGEIFWDISGMFDAHDFVEFSARVRHEHALRGYEWYDLINDPKDDLSEKDMLWSKYPSDEDILRVGVRGLYIGNFFKWDPNAHFKLVKDQYGWRESKKPFERTYRRFSNLDDRYENGSHDFMKFIKFGYGRCSDHASKDIRTGYMSREEGIEKVREYDAVIPSDLYYWLDYVEMSEDEFWNTADTFRDPRVWWIENNEWWKDNLWGEPCSYGPVHLDEKQTESFKNKQKTT
tara:strand:+ start:1853 stop:3061 length:1209 start_codon:yes stop_codon:yes gene_type:complete